MMQKQQVMNHVKCVTRVAICPVSPIFHHFTIKFLVYDCIFVCDSDMGIVVRCAEMLQALDSTCIAGKISIHTWKKIPPHTMAVSQAFSILIQTHIIQEMNTF